MRRINVSGGARWEEIVGYSRAVRVGRHVFVSGTIAADEEGRILGGDDPFAQTAAAIAKIERALHDAGASLRDVVRTRLYVTDIDRWERIAEAHREAFGAVRPAATMVEVSRLIVPEALVEIEAEAVVAGDTPRFVGDPPKSGG